jgi:hypothetical protein
MRIRDLLKNPLFLIWFGAFLGAVASQILTDSLARCENRSYGYSWIPLESCTVFTTFVLFPIALFCLTAIVLALVSQLPSHWLRGASTRSRSPRRPRSTK